MSNIEHKLYFLLFFSNKNIKMCVNQYLHTDKAYLSYESYSVFFFQYLQIQHFKVKWLCVFLLYK